MTSSERIYIIKHRPVSINEAYPKRRGSKGRFLSHAAADFKVAVRDSMKVQDAFAYQGKKLLLDHYEVTALLFLSDSMLFKLNGERRKTVDCTNYSKILEDAVFEYLFPDERSGDYRTCAFRTQFGRSGNEDCIIVVKLVEGSILNRSYLDTLLMALEMTEIVKS